MIGVCGTMAFRAEVLHTRGTLPEHLAAIDALTRLALWPIERIREAVAEPRRVVVVELGDGEALADLAEADERDGEAVARILGARRGA